ncbi:hypothetical protein C8R44DRAFT_732040 [Mycena epipterygia]|nr:hypothetical protein C8R44DRAFT_732040 [Mycena epipterygia]
MTRTCTITSAHARRATSTPATRSPIHDSQRVAATSPQPRRTPLHITLHDGAPNDDADNVSRACPGVQCIGLHVISQASPYDSSSTNDGDSASLVDSDTQRFPQSKRTASICGSRSPHVWGGIEMRTRHPRTAHQRRHRISAAQHARVGATRSVLTLLGSEPRIYAEAPR